MTDQPILEPTEERHIDFYGDDVTALLVPSEAEPEIYVPVKPICDAIGLTWSGQFERIKRDAVLADEVRYIRITRMYPHGENPGGNPDPLCLPLRLLPGWLFGIQPSRVKKPQMREKIIRYQKECFQVLWDAFKQDILPPSTLPRTITPPEQSGAALAYEIATAVQHLARQQMDMEERLSTQISSVDQRVDAVARWAGQVERRMSTLELHLNPEEQITEQQATELALAVKAVGQVLSGAERTKNGYQLVYSELYRRYRVSSYKNLPQGKLNEVMTWLHRWHAELTSGEPTE